VTISSIRSAIAMQVLEQSVVVFSQNYLPLCRVNIKQAEPLNLAVASGLILDVLKHIGLKITAGERKGKVSPINGPDMLRSDHDSCQDGDSNQHLTLFACNFAIACFDRWNNVVNSRNRNRTTKKAGMQLRSKLKPPVPQTIFVHKQFWINLQANLE
jgi:hypothetical protein